MVADLPGNLVMALTIIREVFAGQNLQRNPHGSIVEILSGTNVFRILCDETCGVESQVRGRHTWINIRNRTRYLDSYY
ncbi:unnamed protein product [Rhizophagus irregularis]|nr:unnamed protein product [Rhizophagus irregularis]